MVLAIDCRPGGEGGERSRRWCTKEVRLGPASYISEYHPTLPGVCHMVSIGTHCISTFNGAKIDFSVFHLVFFGQVEKKNFFFNEAHGWELGVETYTEGRPYI